MKETKTDSNIWIFTFFFFSVISFKNSFYSVGVENCKDTPPKIHDWTGREILRRSPRRASERV